MPAITDPNEPYFKDGIWGWIGSVWHKLAMVWGYSDRYLEREMNFNAAAGTDTLTFSVVPAGEVWYIQGICATDAITNITYTLIRVNGDGIDLWLHKKLAPAASETAEYHNPVILKENDFIDVYFSGTVAGDDILAWAWGYKMLIAE